MVVLLSEDIYKHFKNKNGASIQDAKVLLESEIELTLNNKNKQIKDTIFEIVVVQ